MAASAVAVARNGKVFRIGYAILHQRIDARQNVFSRARDDFGDNLHEKFVAVTSGTAIVGLEHKPAVGRGERGPLVPVGFEVVAVGIGRTAMDQRQKRQSFGFKLPRRIDQHAFHGCAIARLPAVGLSLGQFALGEGFVESGKRARVS